jgi:hypothetical protein
MNKIANIAIMNRSAKNTATVHMRDRYRLKVQEINPDNRAYETLTILSGLFLCLSHDQDEKSIPIWVGLWVGHREARVRVRDNFSHASDI